MVMTLYNFHFLFIFIEDFQVYFMARIDHSIYKKISVKATVDQFKQITRRKFISTFYSLSKMHYATISFNSLKHV